MDAAAIKVSLFHYLTTGFAERIEILPSSKAILVHLSHTIEDMMLRRRLPALLFSGFQESSYWQSETERYRQLVGVARQVCIFAGGLLPPEISAREIHIALADDDPLRQEWFICLLSSQISVLLCAQDRQLQALDEELRQFDTLL